MGQPHKQSLFHPAAPAVTTDHPVHEAFLAGWKRSSTAVTGHDHYNHHPCEGAALFDEEMAMYESQISRAVSGHFESVSPSGGGQDLLSPCVTTAAETVHPEPNAPKSQRMERTGTVTSPKRRGMELSAIDQVGGMLYNHIYYYVDLNFSNSCLCRLEGLFSFRCFKFSGMYSMWAISVVAN